MQRHNVEHLRTATTGAANGDLCADSSIYTPFKCRKIENIKVSLLRNAERGEGQNQLNSNAHNIGHERCPSGDS